MTSNEQEKNEQSVIKDGLQKLLMHSHMSVRQYRESVFVYTQVSISYLHKTMRGCEVVKHYNIKMSTVEDCNTTRYKLNLEDLGEHEKSI